MFYKETDFQETSIGRIPRDWDTVKIADIAKTEAGGTPSTFKKEYWNGNIPWINSGELKNNIVNKPTTYISELGLQNSPAKLLPPESVLIALTGATTGMVGYLTFECSTNQSIVGILPNYEKFFPKYLFHYLAYNRKKVLTFNVGSAQPHINKKIVDNLFVALPPIREQRRISDILDTVDFVIAKTDEVIAKTERLKKGLMQTLLTRGIGHKEYKQTPIGTTPKTWQIVSIGDVCEQRNEIVQPSVNNKETFVGLEHISSGETRLHNFAQSADVKSAKFRFYAGDILYGKLRPYLDKAVIADFNGICSTDLLVLTPKENVVKEFLIYILHSDDFIKHAIATTTGTNHPRTSWSAISKFKFGLPERSEQKNIAKTLTAVDMKLELEKKEKARLERIKAGLMDLLLTGKIRVKVD